MQFCTSCGQQLAPGRRFCTACGHPVSQGAEPDADHTVAAQRTDGDPLPPIDPSRPKWITIAIIAAVAVVAAGLGAFLFSIVGGSKNAPTTATSTDSTSPETRSNRSSSTDESSPRSTTSSSAAAPVVPPVRTTLTSGEATSTVGRLYTAWSARDQVTISALVDPQFRAAFGPTFLDSNDIASVTSFDANETLNGSTTRVCSQQLFTRFDGATQTESRCFDVQLKGGFPTIVWTGNQSTERRFS